MRRIHTAIITLILSITVAFPAAARKPEPLALSEVEAFLDEAHQVFNLRDTLRLQPLFWDDAVLIEVVDGVPAQQLKLVDYIMLIQKAWDTMEGYSYDFAVSNVELDGNKAFVTGVLTETFMTPAGARHTTVIREKDTLEKQDGEIRIRSIEIYPSTQRIN